MSSSSEVKQEADQITVSQEKYVLDVLRKFGMLDAVGCQVPMDPKLKLTKQMAPKTEAEQIKAASFPYREIVGSLMYLMISTRPDIAFAVGKLARFMNCHGPSHHDAAKQVLRYLRATSTLGLTYSRSSPTLTAFSDADYASDIDTRRSTTAYIFTLAGAAVSWKSTAQPTVATSTMEAEYMALAEAAKEAIYMRNLCSDFGLSPTEPVTLLGDNQSSIAMAKNPVLHSASKHIDVRHHFVREKVENGDLDLQYISTSLMLADALTKPLSKNLLQGLRSQIFGQKQR